MRIVVPAPMAEAIPLLAMELALIVPVAMFTWPAKELAAFVRNSVPASVWVTVPVALELEMTPDCVMSPAPRKMILVEPPVMPPVSVSAPKPLLLIVTPAAALVRLMTRLVDEPAPV